MGASSLRDYLSGSQRAQVQPYQGGRKVRKQNSSRTPLSSVQDQTISHLLRVTGVKARDKALGPLIWRK